MTVDVHAMSADIIARLYAYHSALMAAAADARNSPEDATNARSAAGDIAKCAWGMAGRMDQRDSWGRVDHAATRSDLPPLVVRSLALEQAKTIKNHREEQGR